MLSFNGYQSWKQNKTKNKRYKDTEIQMEEMQCWLCLLNQDAHLKKDSTQQLHKGF